MNLLGINPLKYFVNAGIVAEAIASIGIGVLLLLFFRNHPLDLLFSGPGGTGDADGSYLDGVLTALAVGGWAFLGFDACSQISEETTDARVSTPRAILRSMLVVGLTVMLTAFAVTLSYQDIGAVVSGQVVDPVTPAVVDAFGAWAERPFVAVVLIAFVACVVSVQTYIGRAIFGMARDAILPGSALLRRVDRRKVPMAAMVCSTLLASLGLALGLNATAVGTLIAFGSGGFFVVFLIVAACALWARLVGRWDPDKGALRLGRAGLAVNVLAVAWLSFEALNVAWPRASLARPTRPWFQVWAVVVVFSALAAFGLLYMVIAKPHRRIATSLSFAAPPADPHAPAVPAPPPVVPARWLRARLILLSRSIAMSDLHYWNYPTDILCGVGALEQLPRRCALAGARRPLLVTDPGMLALEPLRLVRECLERAGIDHDLFHELSSNPSLAEVQGGARRFEAGGHDALIALGGGSALDAAKGIALLSRDPHGLERFEWTQTLRSYPTLADYPLLGLPPLLALPTTAGTGSELGREAVLTDTQLGIKRVVGHRELLAACVFLDPRLTRGLPR